MVRKCEYGPNAMMQPAAMQTPGQENGFRVRGCCVTAWTGSRAAPARAKTVRESVCPAPGIPPLGAGSGGARRQTLHENGAQKQRRPGWR